ncbi:hypothetical protein LCGC14_1841700, partial [marine sediment metagenome]
VGEGWERGTATALIGGRAVETHFGGSFGSSATVKANATVPALDGDRTFAVVLEFPPPPAALNLAKRESVESWLVRVRDTPQIDVLVDTDAFGAAEPYRAVTDSIPAGGSTVVVALAGLFLVFCGPLGCWCCIAELREDKEGEDRFAARRDANKHSDDHLTQRLKQEKGEAAAADDVVIIVAAADHNHGVSLPRVDQPTKCKGSSCSSDAECEDGETTEELTSGDDSSATESTGNAAAAAKCVVCWQRESEVALVPCGHMGFCDACAHKLDACPICWNLITERLTVFNVTTGGDASATDVCKREDRPAV